MKKNTMMRVASALLVAVLMTTCAISGTFAKYITSGDAGDEARVAKFGVEITASGDEAFAPSYESDTTGVTGNTVVAANGTDNLLAPGTSGDLAALTITGTPEVTVKLAVTADLTLEGWTVDGAEYFPVVFTIGTETYGLIAGVDNQSATIAELITAVEEALTTAETVIPANTDLADDYDFEISWTWAYEGNDDAKDTKLGDATTPATIEFEFEATVIQVD